MRLAASESVETSAVTRGWRGSSGLAHTEAIRVKPRAHSVGLCACALARSLGGAAQAWRANITGMGMGEGQPPTTSGARFPRATVLSRGPLAEPWPLPIPSGEEGHCRARTVQGGGLYFGGVGGRGRGSGGWAQARTQLGPPSLTWRQGAV